MALAGLPAWGQDHAKRAGQYVLRASTVRADTLPAAIRSAHGIPADPGQGVLQVVVKHRSGGQWRQVPVRLSVSMRGPLGVPTSLEMHQVATDGGLSYFGVYKVLPRSVLNFRIKARPDAARTGIELVFTDRLGRR